MNGYEDTISVDQVIASIKMKLGIPNISDYDVELEVFINEGIRHLSTNQLFVKKPCVLELEDGKARLPSGYRDWETDRKSTRLNSSHSGESRMPSSA